MSVIDSGGPGKTTKADPAGEGQKDSSGCVPNISRQERKRRLLVGLFTFFVSLIALALLVIIGADRGWRVATFFLFFGAAVGFFQWRDKT